MAASGSSIDTNCMTLNRFILQEQRRFPSATGDLTQLLHSLLTAVKAVASAVRNGGVSGQFGVGADGGSVRQIQSLSNDLFINMIKSSYTVCGMVLQGNTEMIEVETERNAKYIVYIDPLDGCSNIECRVSVGSIFGIAKKPDDCTGPTTMEHCLQPGKNYIASGYALYGSATMLVLTTGNGVNGFTLDSSIGEFLLTDPDLKIKDKGKIYSINEANTLTFEKPVRDYLEYLKDPENGGGTYGARYVGSMIADVHRTIKYGGIFMYPATKANPNGKLHLLYECNPMAHIVEQAGGLASNGTDRILDIVPKSLHDRHPIFIGSKKDVQDYLEFVKKLNE